MKDPNQRLHGQEQVVNVACEGFPKVQSTLVTPDLVTLDAMADSPTASSPMADRTEVSRVVIPLLPYNITDTSRRFPFPFPFDLLQS